MYIEESKKKVKLSKGKGFLWTTPLKNFSLSEVTANLSQEETCI